MKHRRRSTDHVSHERWLVSYADFVTLLFAFFVVMYASAQMDHKKA
ncbi:MAG: flagellar motor protein MotB, partial [Candidatus Korobacteraceae bacterium]